MHIYISVYIYTHTYRYTYVYTYIRLFLVTSFAQEQLNNIDHLTKAVTLPPGHGMRGRAQHAYGTACHGLACHGMQ